ncbi:DUF6230 family protein [Streptomyces netropsis]|uniref:DUF6230 family protein n=1 Tax=Streptomyces netropsis TaxID=55404 RepID=UPI00378C8070
MSTGERSGTDWQRFTWVAAVAAVLAAGAVGSTTAVALPVSFAVAGSSFQVAAEHLHGTGAVQFAAFAQDASGGRHPVTVVGIDSARLTRLCQSSVARTPFGTVTLVITSGGRRPVDARGLVLALENLEGDLTFGGAELGRDASTLGAVGGVRGPRGPYGRQARTLDIHRMRLSSWSITAGSFALRDARMSMKLGDRSCF